MFIFNLFSELCSGDSLPEVEIISLLEEQIPKYKLRADTLTKFGGQYQLTKQTTNTLILVVDKVALTTQN